MGRRAETMGSLVDELLEWTVPFIYRLGGVGEA